MSDATARSFPPPTTVDNVVNHAVGDSHSTPAANERDTTQGSGSKSARIGSAAKREIRYWLEWQSRMISGVISGGIFLTVDSTDKPNFDEIAWPNAQVDIDAHRQVARDTVRAEKPLIRANVVDSSNMVDMVACPIRQNNAMAGAVVFTLTNRTESQRESVQQLMQWCVVWLENLLESQTNALEDAAEIQLQVVKALSEVAPIEVSGYQLCNTLADEFDCSLVALGLGHGLTVRALAVSNQIEFDRRSQRICEIESAMEECADQDSTILLSPEHSDLGVISQAHTQLLKENSELIACSIPVHAEENTIGVITFVRSLNTPFSAEQRYKMDRIAAAIGPVLKLQTLVNQPLSEKIRQSSAEFYRKLIGRSHVRLKTIAALLLLIPLLLVIVPAEQRVTADATLEGTMQQAIVAPINGYIKSVHARAGDAVSAGQSLVTLDDSGLGLQLQKTHAERDKLANEYQLAWANRDKAQVSIISARLAQADAELALVESEKAHSKILAPFDGLLISGDLSRLSGAPVEQGQLLYQLVPLSGFKVILNINEFDVGKLRNGQQGVLRLAGIPGRPIEFEIKKAFPVASVKQNQNVFRVEAILQNPPDNLRPGMQGVGKIIVGRNSIGSVWTQSLRERLKMSAWYFGFYSGSR